jgi:hypothetical protein
MKTRNNRVTLRVLSIAMALFVAGNVFATEIGDMKVKPVNGSKKAVVTVQNMKGEEFSVSIVNSNGWVKYYKEEITDLTIYGKLYDLSNLESGKYKIVFDNRYQLIEKVIKIDNEDVKVIKEAKYLKPTFLDKNNKVSFSYANLNNEKIAVQIKDASGNKIFDEKLDEENVIAKTYNVENLPEGEYTLKVKTSKHTFSHKFEK